MLRRLLDQGGVSLMVGKVIAVPDGKHVTVEVAGQTVVIPGLAGYVPVVGEGCWCLMGNSIVLAIGSASGTRPTTVPSGTVNGQVLVWNSTLAAWQGQTKAPNADTLDGIDSLGFLQQVIGGARKAWWTRFTGNASAGFTTTHAHTLGVVPGLVLATPTMASTAFLGVQSADASNIVLRWQTASGAVDVYILAIG